MPDDDDDDDDDCLLDDDPDDEGLVVKDDDVFADGVMRTCLCVDESNSTPGIDDDAVSTVNPDTSLISQPFAFLLVLSFLLLSSLTLFPLPCSEGMETSTVDDEETWESSGPELVELPTKSDDVVGVIKANLNPPTSLSPTTPP